MPRGGPIGNQHALKHGLYSLQALRKRGNPDRRTSFGKAFREAEQEYIVAYGSDVSPMESRIINDTVWCDFYLIAIDADLIGKRLTRKGRPHPLLEVRLKIAAHRRENFKLLGLKRVAKTVNDWAAKLRQLNEATTSERPNDTN